MTISRPTLLAALLAIAASVFLPGCDDFALADKLYKIIVLDPAKDKVPINDSAIELRVTGGTAPYTFTLTAVDLYSGTSSESIGAIPTGKVSSGTYTPGGAIGRMRITVEDSDGKSDEAYVEVVPPTPSFTLSPTIAGSNMSVVIDVSPYSPSVDHLTLNYQDITGSITLVSDTIDMTGYSTPSDGPSPWLDISATNWSYVFRLYAVAGSYVSLPAVRGLYSP